MLGGIFDLAAQGLKAFNIIEENKNRPDIVASEVAKMRQQYRDAVNAAQAVLADSASSEADKSHAFQFIQRIES